VGGKGGGGGRGEKWTKPCMHIWIIKEKWKKKKGSALQDMNKIKGKQTEKKHACHKYGKMFVSLATKNSYINKEKRHDSNWKIEKIFEQ
jgi:hypothetical protein